MNLFVRGKRLLGVGLVLFFFPAHAQALAPTATAPTTTASRGDAGLQQKRLDFIKKAIALGLIARIEDDSPVTRVLTGPKFYSLSAAEKEDVLNIVWAYYKTADPQKDVVLVIDRDSGKEIGEYSLANGGLKMK